MMVYYSMKSSGHCAAHPKVVVAFDGTKAVVLAVLRNFCLAPTASAPQKDTIVDS